MLKHLVAAASLVLGCAGAGNQLAPEVQPGAPGVKRFLVCAPNTVIALPAELQNGAGPLRNHLDAYLKFHGREVKWLDFYDARQLFAEAHARAKEQGDVEKTVALFAAELSKVYPYDALVMPSLLLHKTRVTESRGRWDGVAKTMRQVNAPELPTGGRVRSSFAEGVRDGGITGDAAVTSVHVLVYTSSGQKVYEGRGGLEFLNEIDLADAKDRSVYHLRQRDDLFESVDALREAIEVAFDPYLPRPEEP